jgi:putative Mg2+ transporter-C (MgtC) family protein
MAPGPAGEALLLLRLVAAAALAAVLGWERERAGKPAGLRTHMLVGLAAALYTALGQVTLGDYTSAPPTGLRADPIRVIQAVALGIGFLGGGVITASHGTGRDSGLTTAASIWSTAAIGIAAGLGHYVLAVGATALQLIVVWGFVRVERSMD